ncbi:MAG: gamma-glutamylcyclotransferase family protein, partial [Solirubrobacterales bacterium]
MTVTEGERGRAAVFGYGSLVSLTSLAEVLGRPAHGSTRARLPGWRRRWSLQRHNLRSEKTFELADGSRPTWILSLNIERAPGSDAAPNGLLFDVSEDELVRLDSRERRYDRVDVTSEIDVAETRRPAGRIYTY